MSKERSQRRAAREEEAARRIAVRERQTARAARRRARRQALTRWIPRPHLQPGVIAARRRRELTGAIGLLLLLNLVVWLVRPDWPARLAALVISVVVFPVVLLAMLMTQLIGPLVVVTGVPGAGKTSLAIPLAGRLGCALISLDEIVELAVEAEDTPREWLRLDAEDELVRRIGALDGEAVVDIGVAPRRDTERVRRLLEPWWERVVELRCEVPADVAVERYAARPRPWPPLPDDADTLARIRDAADHPESLDASRTVLVDTTRPVELDDVANAVRRETATRPRRARH